MRFYIIFSIMLIFFTGSAFASDPLNDPKFRADNDGIWHLWDNPAGLGLSPYIFDAGVSYAPGIPNAWDITAQIPYIDYGASFRYPDVLQQTGLSFGLDNSFSLGFDYRWWQLQTAADYFSIGVISRPYDFLSIGLTYDFSNAPSFGMGLGLRPLSFIEGLGQILTLTADAHTDWKGFVLESIGFRLDFNDSLNLRSWYDFQYGSIGLEVTIALGPGETRASMPSLPDTSDWRVAESFGILKGNAPAPAIDIVGSKIIVIKDIGEIFPTPQTNSLIYTLLNNRNTFNLPELLNMIRRAGKDPSIAAIAFENLPSLGYFASVQETAKALGDFRKTGKKVYFYSDEYFYSGQYQILSSEADLIALNPSGSVNLTGISAQRLYFKDFLDKLGIRFINLAPWDTKSANNPFTYNEMPKGERNMLKRYLGDIADQTLKSFTAGRSGKLKAEPADVIASGPYLSSGKALDAGVVDSVMYKDEFEEWIVKTNNGARIITEYPEPKDLSWGRSSASKKVAVLYLNGAIIMGYGNAGSSIGTSAVDKIKRLREDPDITAILIRVNSPGGVIITSDEIAREVKKTVTAGKPVVVSMGDVAASGGYYVSCYADRIFAEPGTITGSIGVTGLIPNFSGTLGKLGIRSDGVDLSRSSGYLDPAREFKERDISNTREMIITMYDRFVSVVAESRKLTPGRVNEIGEGQVWTGREALTNGLIDEIGSLEDAENYLRTRLGGWVEFDDDIPGNLNMDYGLLENLLKLIASSSEHEDIDNIRTALKPYVKAASEILSLGSGPVLYYDWMGVGE